VKDNEGGIVQMADKKGLTNEEIQEQLKQVDDWDVVDNKKISKTFKFKNFKEALEFTNKVGEVAEDNQHHPDIYLTWGKVSIEVTTHSIDGLSENDFKLAKQIDEKN